MSAKKAATISRKLPARYAPSTKATAASRQTPDLRAAFAIVRAGVLGRGHAASDPVAAGLSSAGLAAAGLAAGKSAGISAVSAASSA
jgi:hypothetical protein